MTPPAIAINAGPKTIEDILAKLSGVTEKGHNEWQADCPCQGHTTPKGHLSVTDAGDKALVKCFGPHSYEDICQALGFGSLSYPNGHMPSLHPAVSGANVQTLSVTSPGITLEQFAQVKHLPVEFLSELAWENVKRKGKPAVRIPYRDAAGDVCSVRLRVGMTGHRFEWRSGDHAMPYGLDRLSEVRQAGWCLIVEGESDAATAWHCDIPCLGIPGKDNWKAQWAAYLQGIPDIYAWQEPGADSFSQKLAASFPNLKVITAPDGIKDISEAHIQGLALNALLLELRAKAVPFAHIMRERQSAVAVGLKLKAQSVLAADDPLELVESAIRELGYGGEIGPALITFLAATSRLLAMRPGQMPVHLLLVGPPGAGKTWTLTVIVRLLPPEAVHTIDAGSPRVLLYDDAELKHKLLVFGEADSLPAGEDNPVASAIRNLLAEGYLHYKVTVRDPDTGDFTVREIDKPGPTVLITTAVRRLGPQLDSRLFSLEVPDGQEQMRCALDTQARIELSGVAVPSESLIAFQGYLQAMAPWDVTVPFADKLSSAIGASPVAARALRDFARLLSLIKTVALLRHTWRAIDGAGRIVATLDDYAFAFHLVEELYSASATGAGQKVRDTVDAVRQLLAEGKSSATVSNVATKLGANVPATSRRVKAAIKGGWLVNEEPRKSAPLKLVLGEPLPAKAGLPTPEQLAGQDVCTPQDGANRLQASLQTHLVSEKGDVCTFAGLTGRDNGGCAPVERQVENEVAL